MTDENTGSQGSVRLIADREIYREVVCTLIPSATRFLWIATSDLKDLYMDNPGHRRMRPFLSLLAELVDRGVVVRLVHAKEPGPVFREEFDRFPQLFDGMERLLCPRVHFKIVVADGVAAYSGSANLTGAGMGAKSDKRRNFECGFVTSDPVLVEWLAGQFDGLWMGAHCADCGRKEYCPDVRDI